MSAMQSRSDVSQQLKDLSVMVTPYKKYEKE
jgi:hypothetical protein